MRVRADACRAQKAKLPTSRRREIGRLDRASLREVYQGVARGLGTFGNLVAGHRMKERKHQETLTGRGKERLSVEPRDRLKGRGSLVKGQRQLK